MARGIRVREATIGPLVDTVPGVNEDGEPVEVQRVDIDNRATRQLGEVSIVGSLPPIDGVASEDTLAALLALAEAQPLPAGAATEAAQDAQQTTLEAIFAEVVDAATQATLAALLTRADLLGTEATLDTIRARAALLASETTLAAVGALLATSLPRTVSGTVEVSSSALPALAATAAIQATQQTALDAIVASVAAAATQTTLSALLTRANLLGTEATLDAIRARAALLGTESTLVALGSLLSTSLPRTVSGTVTATGPLTAAQLTTEALAKEETVGKRFDGNKTTGAAAVISSSGDNTIVTPTLGTRLTLFWIFLSSSQDNSAEVLATVRLGAKVVYRCYLGNPGAWGHWEPVVADNVNDALIVELSSAGQNVAVSYTVTEA